MALGLSEIESRQVTLTWPMFLLVAGLGLATLFTLLSPEASRSLMPLERFLFWVLHVGGLLCLMQCAQSFLSGMALVRSTAPWLQLVTSGFTGAALFAPIGAGLDQLFGLAAITDDANLGWAYRVLDDFAAIAPPAVFTWVGLNAARNLRLPTVLETARRLPSFERELNESARWTPLPPAAHTPPQATPSEVAEPLFWSRVPMSLGRDLIAMTAELHYLRIVTTKGNVLILYAFGQAVAELSGSIQGSQIHRSHWVAHSHVVKIRREGKRLFCLLSNGSILPVGRRRQAVVARLSSV